MLPAAQSRPTVDLPGRKNCDENSLAKLRFWKKIPAVGNRRRVQPVVAVREWPEETHAARGPANEGCSGNHTGLASAAAAPRSGGPHATRWSAAAPPAPPPPVGTPSTTPMTYHGGPVLRHANLFTAFWGPFTDAEIIQVRNYVNGLAGHLSGNGAPAGQVPVLWQYNCRSATLEDGYHVDDQVPPSIPLMAPGAPIAAIAPRDGHIDLFVVDAAGIVWSTWWEADSGWQLWFPIRPGTPMNGGAAVTALTPRDGHIDLFSTDSHGTTWSTWWEAAAGWQPWFAIRPERTLQPGTTIAAIVPRAGHIDLFATDSTGAVFSTWWEAGPNWQPWFRIGNAAVQPGARVTALVPRDGHIDLFAIDSAGLVRSSWWEAAAGWQAWFPIHAERPMQPGTAVTAIAPRNGHIDLFATDENGVVWSSWWEQAPGWQAWFQISPGTAMQPGAPVTALAPRNGHIDLFVIDASDTVWSTWWEAASGWQPWFPLFPSVPLSRGAAVTALVPRADHIDLFVTAFNGSVCSAWWEPAAGWRKWFMPGATPEGAVVSRIKAWQDAGFVPPYAPDRIVMVVTKNVRLSGYGVEWCGFHNSVGTGQYYSVTPLLTPDARCSNNDTPSFQSVVSHEVQEAMTDPLVGAGWYDDDAAKDEGGDLKACNFNTQGLPFGTVQQFQDNRGLTCSIWIPSLLMPDGAMVTAIVPREGHIDLFATDKTGLVWSAWWEAGPDWQAWFPIAQKPKMQAGAPVTALVPRDGHIDLFVTDAAGAVWSTWWEAAAGWQSWFQISPGRAMAPGARVAAIARRDGHIDLFTTDSSGAVWSTWWEAAANWQPWFTIGAETMQIGAPVTALVPRDGHIDLFATGGRGGVWLNVLGGRRRVAAVVSGQPGRADATRPVRHRALAAGRPYRSVCGR